MVYPTREEVQKASREQLKIWYKELPSAGTSACREPVEIYRKVMDQELSIMALISLNLIVK